MDTHYSKGTVVLQFLRAILYVARWKFAGFLGVLVSIFAVRVVTGYTVLDYIVYTLLEVNVLAFGWTVIGAIHETEHLLKAIHVDLKTNYIVVSSPVSIFLDIEDIDEVDVTKKESYWRRLLDIGAAPYLSIACNMAHLMLTVILFIIAWQSPQPLNVIAFLGVSLFLWFWIAPFAFTLVLKSGRSNRILSKLACFWSAECKVMEKIVSNDTDDLADLISKLKKRVTAKSRLISFGHVASIPVYVPRGRIYVPSKNR